jgi:ABC-type nitrate/sulfonate/bicarbonate transport system permease component
MTRSAVRALGRSSLSIAFALLLWGAVAHSGRVNAFLLPPPDAVVERLADSVGSGQLLADGALTLYRTLAGFALAVIVGAVVGFSMGASRATEWLLSPIVSFLFATPKISFLPVFIVWFGTFDGSKILMTAFICCFPVISACHAGVKDVSRLWRWVGENIGMSRRRITLKILVPATLPALLSGAQISLPFAFIAVTVAEMIAGGGGLGARMMLAARFADSPSVVAAILAIGLLGLLLSSLLTVLRHRLLSWHTEIEAVGG